MSGRALALGAVVAVGVDRALAGREPAAWRRLNHRGREVSLRSGPAAALAAVVAGGLPLPAAVVAGCGAAALGAYDDLAGHGDPAKGLRGHLQAAREGRLTSGGAKVAGIGACGLLAAALLDGGRGRRLGMPTVVAGAVVAGAANLVNLLDLRPGRALKAAGLGAAAVGAPGVVGACAALLPGDLRERTMLGDCGANGVGAVVGLALVDRTGRRGRVAALAVLVGLTAASERVSFSAVIDRTPPLRALDRAGRLP